MKLLIFVLAGSIFISDYQKKSKLELLSHKWRQVGIKFHDKRYNPIPQTRADVYTINNDGTFQVLGPNL